MAMFQGKSKTVAEYLQSLPEDRREVVGKLRTMVKKHLPKGYEEQVGFGIITYAVPLAKLSCSVPALPAISSVTPVVRLPLL